MAIALDLRIASGVNPKSLTDDLNPVAEEVNQNGGQGADVKRDIIAESRIGPAEQAGQNGQMRSAADGQKLGEALDDAQENHFD